MSDQRQLQEKAAQVRLHMVTVIGDHVQSRSSMPMDWLMLFEGLADLLNRVAGPASSPLKAIGGYMAAIEPEAKASNES